MKPYWGSGGVAPAFLSSTIAVRCCLNPKEEATVPTEQEAGWAPEPVWNLKRREKSLVPAGNPILVVQTVTYTLY
jgi:hypothetical protein